MIQNCADATFDDSIRLWTIWNGEVSGDVEDGSKCCDDVGGEVGSVVAAKVIRNAIATEDG